MINQSLLISSNGLVIDSDSIGDELAHYVLINRLTPKLDEESM